MLICDGDKDCTSVFRAHWKFSCVTFLENVDVLYMFTTYSYQLWHLGKKSLRWGYGVSLFQNRLLNNVVGMNCRSSCMQLAFQNRCYCMICHDQCSNMCSFMFDMLWLISVFPKLEYRWIVLRQCMTQALWPLQYIYGVLRGHLFGRIGAIQGQIEAHDFGRYLLNCNGLHVAMRFDYTMDISTTELVRLCTCIFVQASMHVHGEIAFAHPIPLGQGNEMNSWPVFIFLLHNTPLFNMVAAHDLLTTCPFLCAVDEILFFISFCFSM